MKLRHLIFTALATSILCACQTTDATVSSDPNGEPEMTGMANPFVNYRQIEQAEKSAGFTLLAPEEINAEYSECIYRAVASKMIEVIYPSSLSEDEIRIRKAKGSDDISGDYNTYDSAMDIIINGHTIQSRGNGTKTNVAVWQDEDFSYSVTSTKGLSLGLLREIIEQIQ